VKYLQFDQNVSAEQRDKLFDFYRACIKRATYCALRERMFLSKNPMFSTKVATLQEQFPDARFIYMVRNPIETVPSAISEGFATCTYVTENDRPNDEFQELIYGAVKKFYEYPLSVLEQSKTKKYCIVQFRELTRHPEKTVESIYRELGLEITPEYRKSLRLEAQKSLAYRSKHSYSLDDYRISEQRIRMELGKIFRRFGFQ
jgi:hypothetical protein